MALFLSTYSERVEIIIFASKISFDDYFLCNLSERPWKSYPSDGLLLLFSHNTVAGNPVCGEGEGGWREGEEEYIPNTEWEKKYLLQQCNMFFFYTPKKLRDV